MIGSVPILCFAIYRVFVPPAEPSAAYLLGWLLVLYVGWTMLTISHAAWASACVLWVAMRSELEQYRSATWLHVEGV